MKPKPYFERAKQYARDVITGKIIACDDTINACKRFETDLKREDLEFRPRLADQICSIMETILVHRKGETLEGEPLLGKPFLLLPWQIFIIYNLLGFYKKGTEERRFKEAFIMVARKNGKALSLDTPIPTPDGWKQLREIHQGDIVFGRNGEPAEVIVESEVFNKPMYEVIFEDGEVVKASADHIWTVQTKKSRRAFRESAWRGSKNCKEEYREKGGWYEITTAEMSGDYAQKRADGKGVEYKYRVPMNDPVRHPEKSLIVDPYVLGVWLGDGTSDDTSITCANADKDELMSLVSERGHKCRWYEHKNRAGCFGVDKIRRNDPHSGRINPFREKLRKIGVFDNKHIPDIYMQASVSQRMELLRGLMDTDGYCSKAGQCEFCQKSEFLVDQVQELLSGLGIKNRKREKIIRCNGKECRAYSVLFFCDKTNSCFKLKRKKERLKDRLAPRMKAKSIIGIRPIPQEPSKCIAVGNEEHLFLCGKRYTVTHNTSFIGGLALALAIMQRKSGATAYVVAAALKQALETYRFLDFSIRYKGLKDFEMHDNSFEHSIKHEFIKNGKPDGSIEIQIMASNPKAQDSFNCNFAIADEVAAYTTPAQYTRFQEAMKSYTNKLMVGITTAGDNINSFGYTQMNYAVQVAAGTVKNDGFFAFVARADQDDKGNVDILDPIQHQKANPSYGETIRPTDIMQEAQQAQDNPMKRKDFLSRSLNVYTSAVRAYFDLEEFKRSDQQYDWTMEELAMLPIQWYGGADLSRLHDLTAGALFGQYDGVDIIITHAFCPVAMAASKAEEDGIPVDWWKEQGWLTMSNSPTVQMADIVQWFIDMRAAGFKIRQVGHDRKFAGEEYFPLMKEAKFSIVDQPQLYYLKSRGFRHIERAAKDGKLYYLHNAAYEYCISNVHAVEKIDDAVQYDKVATNTRIDLFDASVFACVRCLEAADKARKNQKWFGVNQQ